VWKRARFGYSAINLPGFVLEIMAKKVINGAEFVTSAKVLPILSHVCCGCVHDKTLADVTLSCPVPRFRGPPPVWLDENRRRARDRSRPYSGKTLKLRRTQCEIEARVSLIRHE